MKKPEKYKCKKSESECQKIYPIICEIKTVSWTDYLQSLRKHDPAKYWGLCKQYAVQKELWPNQLVATARQKVLWPWGGHTDGAAPEWYG